MTILLLGANGQVGHELRRSLVALGDVVATTRSGTLPDGGACEVADFDQPDSLAALVERIAPIAVVNAAAYTAVDKAEDDEAAAFRTNAEAPGVLARACASRGIPFVHYSTDYVFDGRGTRPYREDDAVDPLGVYGASKRAGEDAVRAAGGVHLILRTAWVYGLHGHNFLRTMLRVGAEREELRVVADQIGTPDTCQPDCRRHGGVAACARSCIRHVPPDPAWRNELARLCGSHLRRSARPGLDGTCAARRRDRYGRLSDACAAAGVFPPRHRKARAAPGPCIARVARRPSQSACRLIRHWAAAWACARPYC